MRKDWIMAFLLGGALLMGRAAIPAMAQTPVSQVTASNPTPDDRARQWLTLIDDGDWSHARQEAGSALKDQQDAKAWTAKIRALRAPMGAMASRDLKSIELSRPDLAVVRYDSVFAHKAAAVETVTLRLGKGGWSVTGYAVE